MASNIRASYTTGMASPWRTCRSLDKMDRDSAQRRFASAGRCACDYHYCYQQGYGYRYTPENGRPAGSKADRK